VRAEGNVFALQSLFEPCDHSAVDEVARSKQFMRRKAVLYSSAEILIDEFPSEPGASCRFFRLQPGPQRRVRFEAGGGHTIQSCPSGGWIIQSRSDSHLTYWLPHPPALRRVDSHGRILSEERASLTSFTVSPTELAVDIDVPQGLLLDFVVWQFAANARDLAADLASPLVLEMQPVFMWGSHTAARGPGEAYRYLIHGSVYENRFEPRRKWKICAENEAYSLYVMLHGLEVATRKRLYTLLKRQLLCSVMARQSEDGGWYHGEWSDAMESHYRLHNGGVLVLEAALEQWPDDSTRTSLDKAAGFAARHTDETDLGLWFLHDSLEEDLELRRESSSPLVVSRTLGKALGNGLVLNTHLDSIIVLDRYRQITGNTEYATVVDAARDTVRRLLALRPAQLLYRLIYSAVDLTLLPSAEARQLPLVLRALKRAAREYLLPRLYVVKQRFPRIVMPGGLIERHISMPNLDLNYHTVNLMDLARLWRRFPDEPLAGVVEDAVSAVRNSSLLSYWVELKQRQALGYWLEALYRLCTLSRKPEYRRYLAEGVLIAEDLSLGLPPSLLGANPEAVPVEQRMPCPSPSDARLRVVNLSSGGTWEILVVNGDTMAIDLAWESGPQKDLAWKSPDGPMPPDHASPLSVRPRGWLLGTDRHPS